MKTIFAISLAAVSLLTACQTVTPDAAPTTAVTPLVGKKLMADNGLVIIMNADGTVSGTARGEDIDGTYVATAKEVCSTYAAPEFLAGKEFCSEPQIDGNTVVFLRRDGSKSATYTIGG
ncbi:hypothetical protein TRP8649_04326 [Pelagimonas phthalicica]|uniref:Lipoprotein n=1 Tax=Pelagimonas phthalicica TaxID=1037362 RepID=A0A238JJ23_9RHOB|nr:hypothetical protein [Pelagimonas phthalicica]TDS90017.1 hypothetical protein CLV87_4072 [Pelagimonas phthalicica]SMX30184.1 hypothetical protein TRP8649_04326 [Pelagimonas phthalicica]